MTSFAEAFRRGGTDDDHQEVVVTSKLNKALVAGLAGVALGAAIGGGVVAVAATSTTVIKACAARSGGALRLASRCHSNERAVHWNVTGPQGKPGTPATKLFANIDSTGKVVSGSLGVVAEEVSTDPGLYDVKFGQDISRCTAVANVGSVPLFSGNGSGTGRQVAFANVSQYSPGAYYDPPTDNLPTGQTVAVEVYLPNGSLTEGSFHLAVFC
jgi:hypothetical protein